MCVVKRHQRYSYQISMLHTIIYDIYGINIIDLKPSKPVSETFVKNNLFPNTFYFEVAPGLKFMPHLWLYHKHLQNILVYKSVYIICT